MSTITYAGTIVDVDAEGFLTDPAQWNEQIAAEIAAENGIAELTDRHWLVVNFMRDDVPARPARRRRSARSARRRGCRSRSSTSCSRRARPSSPPRSAASRSRAAASRRNDEHASNGRSSDEPIEKVSIIVSKGSLEGVYPGLIMANGARMEGIEANLFFTFFGLDAINKAKHEHVKVATVGNPGLHLATWAGGVPGSLALVTHKLAQEMEKLDIPPIPEFVEMIADSGAGLYACKASVDLFGLTRTTSSPRSRT